MAYQAQARRKGLTVNPVAVASHPYAYAHRGMQYIGSSGYRHGFSSLQGCSVCGVGAESSTTTTPSTTSNEAQQAAQGAGTLLLMGFAILGLLWILPKP